MAEQDTQGGAADRQRDDTDGQDKRQDATKTPPADDSEDAGGSGAGYGNHGEA